MNAGRVTFNELKNMRGSTWRTAFDVMAKEGLVMPRTPSPIWLYVLIVVVLAAAFVTPLAARGWENIPTIIVALAVFALTAGAAMVRALEVARLATIVADDYGFEVWRGQSRRGRIAWRDVLRAGPFVTSKYQRLALPADFDGRDLLVQLIAWCRENRTRIGAADGSITRAVEAMAADEGMKFEFDRWAASTSSILFGGVFLAFAASIVGDRPFDQYGAWDAAMAALGLLLLGGFAALSTVAWFDAGQELVVSSKGLAEYRQRRLVRELTWDQMTHVDALRRRREGEVLGCNSDGSTVIEGSNLKYQAVLGATVEHLLVRELERRGLTRSLRPEDVRPQAR